MNKTRKLCPLCHSREQSKINLICQIDISGRSCILNSCRVAARPMESKIMACERRPRLADNAWLIAPLGCTLPTFPRQVTDQELDACVDGIFRQFDRATILLTGGFDD